MSLILQSAASTEHDQLRSSPDTLASGEAAGDSTDATGIRVEARNQRHNVMHSFYLSAAFDDELDELDDDDDELSEAVVELSDELASDDVEPFVELDDVLALFEPRLSVT